MMRVGWGQRGAASPRRGLGTLDFEALVDAGRTRSEALVARLRARLARFDRIDPLAVLLEAAADLSAVGQARSERLLCHLKYRARLMHDRLRLSRPIDWIG